MTDSRTLSDSKKIAIASLYLASSNAIYPKTSTHVSEPMMAIFSSCAVLLSLTFVAHS